MVYYKTILEAAKHFTEKRAFLFDMDGLIFDTEQLFMEQLAIVMKEHGYTLTKELYVQSLGLTGETLKNLMCGAYGEDYPFAELGAESRRRVSIVAETVGLRVKPGIRALLEWLREQHKNCAVVSSTHAEYVRKYLEYAGIDSYFMEVIGGDMVEKSKPEPDIFLLGCEKTGVTPDEAVVLEDSENGIRSASRAGIATICVPDLKFPGEQVLPLIDVIVTAGEITE